MCNRPGGSCIKCRVLNCSVRFHPWCAHQKVSALVMLKKGISIVFCSYCIYDLCRSSFTSTINFVLCLQGLLQSEVEGINNENVGFYGRCARHATHPMCESDSDPADTDRVAGGSAVEELTCARTEVYYMLFETTSLTSMC